MNILEKIIEKKKGEVADRKKKTDIGVLESSRYFQRATGSLRNSVLDGTRNGIIAEFKRRSPSRGVINNRDSVESVTRFYTAFGASGISILTDQEFFGGSLDDLLAARDNSIPLLRKDFIIDEYQILEAKAFGADAILLIAAVLDRKQTKELSDAAHKLGLEVLLEIHEESEVDHIDPTVDLVGVNNRNLKDFEVNLEHSVRLSEKIGEGFVKIAESGIRSVEDVRFLKKQGFNGFLIGEHFMKQQDPGTAFKNFSYEL